MILTVHLVSHFLLYYADGAKSYIIALNGLKLQTVVSGVAKLLLR